MINIDEDDNAMGMAGGWPSSVKIFHDGDDMSVASEITFQSAVRNISMGRLMQLMQPGLSQEQLMGRSSQTSSMGGNEDICVDWSGSKVAVSRYHTPKTSAAYQEERQHHPAGRSTNCLSVIAARRFTEPHTSSRSHSSSEHIKTIIELKLQVANQKETIDRLTSDLNHSLSEKRVLLTQTKRFAKPLFAMASLAEELQSDNSRREDMNRLQKSMDLQQETIAVLEADNRRLRKERNSLQRQIDRMSCKLTESSHSSSSSASDPHLHHDAPSGSQDVTASLTDASRLSGCELISPTDLTLMCYQPRRAITEYQRQDELGHTSYLPWCKVKRIFSEPVNSNGQQHNTTSVGHYDVELSASRNENKNGWFISEESENIFQSIDGSEGTEVPEERNTKVPHRRSSMPTESAQTSYLPCWTKIKKRFSEPVNSSGQRHSTTPKHDVELSGSRNEHKNGWFVSEKSESSFLSKMTYTREGTEVPNEKIIQVPHRRSSMHDKLALSTASSPPTRPRRTSFLNVSKRNESCGSYVQSEETNFKSIDWGDYDFNDDAEV